MSSIDRPKKRHRSFAVTGNKRTRRRKFGSALAHVRREVNCTEMPRSERRIEFLAAKHELEFRIRPSAIIIRRSGHFSKEAAAVSQAFIDYKRRNPKRVPYEQWTPLQKRMQSGGA